MRVEVDLDVQRAARYLVSELEGFERQKAIQEGMLRAARVFARRGRSNLRAKLLHHGRQTGRLMSSLTTLYRKKEVMSLAGYRGIGRHAHVVDLGTRRRTTKDGKNRGIMPPNYFWTDARQSEERTAMQEILYGIEQAVRRIQSRM